MTAFNYTAKRGMVKTAFAVTGSDISAANADGSFNATATDLSGLLDNEWLTVSGFTDAANNGLFEVNGNSITTKIIQDTSALVDEAAGASIVLQGYVRGIGQTYDLETEAHSIIPQDEPIAKRAQALDGTPETIYTRNDRIWSVFTDFITAENFLQWREFMNSVHGGEQFTFDPYGTIAVPDAPVQVELIGAPQYANPYAKVMQIGFKVREV